MATRAELRALALLRMEEAESLFAAGYFDGAVYLAGYVVELALKARICRVLQLVDYPGVGNLGRALKTHDLDELKVLAGLQNAITAAKPRLFANWSLATRWTPEQRYAPKGSYDRVTARAILDSIKARPDGVLTWLRRRW